MRPCWHRERARAAVRTGALAVVLAALMQPTAMADGLPRVLLAPAERAAITASRFSGRPLPLAAAQPGTPAASAQRPAEPAQTPSAAVVPRTARIDGVTFGGGSRQAVWIAGERIADGGLWSGHRVRVTRDGVNLTAPDGSVRVLRVGMAVGP